MRWTVWHTIGAFAAGFGLVVSCASGDKSGPAPDPATSGAGGIGGASSQGGIGGVAGGSMDDSSSSQMMDASSSNAMASANSSAMASSGISSGAGTGTGSGGGMQACKATVDCKAMGSCCCTFFNVGYCIGASMCTMGGGKCAP